MFALHTCGKPNPYANRIAQNGPIYIFSFTELLTHKVWLLYSHVDILFSYSKIIAIFILNY